MAKVYQRRMRWLIVAFLTIGLLLVGFLLWKSKGWNGRFNPRWEIQQRILLERFEKMQKLQVLSSHLLAHERFRHPSFFNASEFVIIARAKAVYGLDMSQVKLRREDNTLRVELPRVRVQDLIMNAKDVEFIGVKKGLLTSQATFESFKQEAVQELHGELSRQARDPKLIAEATAQARDYFKTLFKTAGFKQVEFYEKAAL